ncbi:MAG: hypothetical protein IKN96_08525 [Oscillibacter sp.]|nr:hypothetical protein [Oscillibacter sp.]
MEYAYSILMFCFAGAILLYAALVPGNPGMIRRLYAAKVKDKKAYAKQFAKVLALVSLAPLSSRVAALIVDINRRPLVPVITLAVVFIACMQKGAKMMEEVM